VREGHADAGRVHRRTLRRDATVTGVAARLAVAAVVLLACASPAGSDQHTATPVSGWLTTADRRHLLAPMAPMAFSRQPPAAGAGVLAVDATQRFQTLAGFGAALTHSSAWLLHRRLSPPARRALLHELFGRGEAHGVTGIGLSLVRVSIGASDFSLRHASLDDRPPGETDETLAHFGLDDDRADVLPLLREARTLNPALAVIAAPWSAPAWMKTSGRLAGGTLRPEFFDAYARYLLRFVDAFAAEGVPVFAISLQNEPRHEPADYPGMRLAPAQRATLLADHLGPRLAARGHAPQVLEWDHNWDEPASPLAVLSDARARPFVAGVAWHCYAGDVQAQSLVHSAYPDKDTWFTECSGGEWAPSWQQSLPWLMRHVVIGASRHRARGVLLWNLALDERHGPHRGGCRDCRGVVTIDGRSGAVTRNLEYYGLAHASRFVRPGAVRVASDSDLDEVHSVAFVHDDGQAVLLLCNAADQPRTLTLRDGDRVLSLTLPASSVATLVWQR
jgi:glucosylceramidase